MAIFKNLDENSDITDITFNDRKRLGPLDKASQRIMRGKSSFTNSQKETMAAFVSGLNACQFCYGSHVAVAEQFGVDPNIIEELVENIDDAKVSANLKPVFHYLKKLTLESSKIIESDAQAVFNAGWTEDDLNEVILIGCLFNFYNRLLDGHGVKGKKEIYQIGGEVLSKRGYGVPWFIGLIKKTIRKSKVKRIQELSTNVNNH
jgi:uncharacterized peroxidase-related enzyme